MSFHDLMHEATSDGASTDFLCGCDLDALVESGDWQGVLDRLQRATDSRFDAVMHYVRGRIDEQEAGLSAYWVAQARDAREEQARLEHQASRLGTRLEQDKAEHTRLVNMVTEDALVLHCWIDLVWDNLPRGVRESLDPPRTSISAIQARLQQVYEQLDDEEASRLVGTASGNFGITGSEG